jgi:hypothetical protein
LRVEAESLKQKPPRRTVVREEEVKDIPTAPKLDQEMRSRKELGKLFNVSHEAIRLWEENGKLKEVGWERIPSAGNPVRYKRVVTA